ncbi:MAG: hypothetical protein K2J04_14630 [Lachnospiraceae bacterium]|nr:hypothetical protein [Lachnospiraceae bacterium]
MLCFAADGNGADEVDDYEFYKSRQTGVAFTEERLKEFWGEKFDIVELQKGKNIVQPEMWESEYLYVCVLKQL